MENTIDNKEIAKKNDKGFTLVELLIVIVVLGILATITVFAVGGITSQGQEAACETEERSLETAIAAVYATSDDNTYPAHIFNEVKDAAGDLVDQNDDLVPEFYSADDAKDLEVRWTLSPTGDAPVAQTDAKCEA